MRKEPYKEWIYITDSLLVMPETNTTLQVYYTPTNLNTELKKSLKREEKPSKF